MDYLENVTLNDILKIAQITEQVERIGSTEIRTKLLSKIQKTLGGT